MIRRYFVVAVTCDGHEVLRARFEPHRCENATVDCSDSAEARHEARKGGWRRIAAGRWLCAECRKVAAEAEGRL